MKIDKILFVSLSFVLLIVAYNFGRTSVQLPECKPDCSGWQKEAFDIAWIASRYQKMYYSCKSGDENIKETDAIKKEIDDLIRKYNLDKGVPRP